MVATPAVASWQQWQPPLSWSPCWCRARRTPPPPPAPPSRGTSASPLASAGAPPPTTTALGGGRRAVALLQRPGQGALMTPPSATPACPGRAAEAVGLLNPAKLSAIESGQLVTGSTQGTMQGTAGLQGGGQFMRGTP